MTTVVLDDAQARAVRDLVAARLGNLSSEIRHTDSPAVRAQMRAERELLADLLQRLPEEGPAAVG